MNNDVISHYANDWRARGLAKGDIVLLHSSLKRTMFRDRSKLRSINVVEVIHRSFLEVIGSEGTLVYPTFNFDFSNGLAYSTLHTPSAMGSLTEFARQMASFRTGHPVYSFVAFGARADLFANVDNFSAYGPDSPFAILHEQNAKIAVLNLPDQNSMTFYHHVEEMLGCGYRYQKSFSNAYVDRFGNSSKRTYSIYVRDVDGGVRTYVNPMGELLWNSGVYNGDRYSEGSGLRWAHAREIFDATAQVINAGRAQGLLFERDEVSGQSCT